MDIEQRLKVFLAVARCGGFTKAKGVANSSQEAMSLLIKELEKELGATLFNRLPRKVTLTDEGKLFRGLAAPLLDDIKSLKTKFNEARGKGMAANLTIATQSSVMTYLLPGVVMAFRKRYPNCELSILARIRADILAMLQNGEADIGLASLSAVPAGFDYKVFKAFDRILIAPHNHPLSKKRAISPADIAIYPLIVPALGSNTRNVIDTVFEHHGLTYKKAMEVTGREAVKEYVGMGLGISILNEYYLDDDKKRLFTKNVSDYFGTAERGIITKKNRYLSSPAKEFIRLLTAKFKSH
jgi:DNA-binding transcriptional LysR family regulator